VRGLVLSVCAIAAALAVAAPASAEILALGGPLWLVSDDGAMRTKLPGTAGARRPDWSPDGSQIVFERFARDRGRLFAGPPEGPFTEIPGSEGLSEPAWSPDGTTIAASRDAAGKGPYLNDLVLLPAAGGTPRVLTAGSNDNDPEWSPDGTQLAFTRYPTSPPRESDLMVVSADGSGLRLLTKSAFEAAWSPDGSTIAFATERDDNGVWCPEESDDCETSDELYVIGADGSGERRLTDTTSDETEPAWAPDGSRIVFASDRHYPQAGADEIFVMDADGGCVTQLTIGSDVLHQPVWRPGRPVARGACGVRIAPFVTGADLGDVRVPGATPLFPGNEFGGMRVGYARRRAIVYDECVLAVPGRCAGSILLESYTTCARNPARNALPVFWVEAYRGGLLLKIDGRYEFYSGGTVTLMFLDVETRRFVHRIVDALRPVRTPGAKPPRRFAGPQFPPAVWRQLLFSQRLRTQSRYFKRHVLVRSDRKVVKALSRLRTGRRPACA
jgi:TolB protein